MTHTALIIGCGGPGCNIVSRVFGSSGHPTLTVNWSGADIPLLPPGEPEEDYHGDPKASIMLLDARRNEIMLNLKGYSDLILVTALGGGLGTAAVRFISECARSNGSRFMAAVVLPFKFEEERRARTLKEAPAVTDMADRVFLMDMQRIIETGGSEYVAGDAIDAAEDLLANAVVKIADLLDTIPFLSTFTRKAYSFSYDDAGSLNRSVDSAMTHPMYDLGPGDGKMVICCDAAVPDEVLEATGDRVTDLTGIRPETINGTGSEGHGVTIFMPISFRRSR